MAVTRAMLHDALPRLRGRRILVVGDMLLDEYIYGTVQRVSREAPIPVLERRRAAAQPGGGAFPALAVRAMGGESRMVGVVGADETGRALRGYLGAAGVDTTDVIDDPERVTTCKTRFVAEGFFRFPQQVFRVDTGTRGALDTATEARMIAAIRHADDREAILVSEYSYGAVTPAVARVVAETGIARGIVTAVDAQGSLDPYRGYSLVRDNRADAAAYLGEPLDTVPRVLAALPRMRDRLGARNVVVSLGDAGLAYLGDGGDARHVRADRVDVYDVTGAGDTLIVVMTLALAAGLSLEIAAHLGNLAAGVAVRKLGNAVVDAGELARAIDEADDAIFAPAGEGV
jgi:rfaE bifunctional protein kinase chain/domain